ncbi:MAG: glycosyltransferase family A protein [Nakamurella sp.]
MTTKPGRRWWPRRRPSRPDGPARPLDPDRSAAGPLESRLQAVEYLQTVVNQRTELLSARVRDVGLLVETVGPLTVLEDEQAAAGDRIERLESRLAEIERGLAAVAARQAALEDAQARTWGQLEGVHGSLVRHATLLEVSTVMQWIRHTTLSSQPLVSVVLPTHDRAHLINRAVSSVLGQSYPNWELLIVDDGSVDTTRAELAGIGDPRVRVTHTANGGVCAARNVGLELARGDIITYLDDDNLMHPEWLRSVVWRFDSEPGADVLWGAIVVDDMARVNQRGRGDLPRLSFLPYDRQQITTANIADIGAIAHRSDLAEARFDESLREMGDWDLFLRLTRESDPVPLPAIACLYTTDGPDRLSHGPTYEADLARVRAKNRR